MNDINNNAVGKWLSNWMERYQIPKWKVCLSINLDQKYFDMILRGQLMPTRKHLELLYVNFIMTFGEYLDILRICGMEYLAVESQRDSKSDDSNIRRAPINDTDLDPTQHLILYSL